MKISIIGLGWLGQALASNLSVEHEIYGTTRDSEKLEKLKSNYHVEILNLDSSLSDGMLNTDIIILNIPPFKNLLSWLKSWNWNFDKKIIFLSSISVYELNEGNIDETTKPLFDSEKPRELLEQEEWIRNSFKSHVIIRLGGLIGPDRHPGNILAGRKDIPSGEKPVNLIHQLDIVGFVQEIIKNEHWGELFNLVYPSHPTRGEYYADFAKKHHLEGPTFVIGNSKGKIVDSQKIEKIYKFQHPI